MNRISETETELTAEYIRDLVDAESRRRLGISGEEMLGRYERGELEDAGRVADLIVLAGLLREPTAA
jgi:molecular chaperone DnaK (HSP70)